MILSETPRESRGLFLLKLTEQLIKNTEAANMYRLETILEDLFPEIKTQPKKIITKDEIIKRIKEKQKPSQKRKEKPEIAKEIPMSHSFPTNTFQMIKNQKRVFRLPEPKLPKTLQDLKPKATSEKIDLKRLNTLLDDSNVNSMESEGPNKRIIVEGIMGRKKTNIILEKQEIQNILDEFSTKSKIPLVEGITKIALGDLILTATISKDSGPQFTIRKMRLNQIQPYVPKPK